MALISVLECSLAAWRAEKLAKEMGIYSQLAHCLEDGSYDPLQCDESDLCTCLQIGSNIPGSVRVPEIDIKSKLQCCKHLILMNELSL